MPQKPERPFVPHRTPKRAPPAVSASEFRLYRPFVPGSERDDAEQHTLSAGTVESQAEMPISLRPIADFLDSSVPAAAVPPQVTSDNSYVAEFETQPEELPPVEHFMDPLPAEDIFAPENVGPSSDTVSSARNDLPTTGANGPNSFETGWLETDWQQFDWRAAAALGEGHDDASRAWATTDWDGTVARSRDLPAPTANSIATALDEIARRIRDGELAVPGSGATPDPATIAATLAALLGVRH